MLSLLALLALLSAATRPASSVRHPARPLRVVTARPGAEPMKERIELSFVPGSGLRATGWQCLLPAPLQPGPCEQLLSLAGAIPLRLVRALRLLPLLLLLLLRLPLLPLSLLQPQLRLTQPQLRGLLLPLPSLHPQSRLPLLPLPPLPLLPLPLQLHAAGVLQQLARQLRTLPHPPQQQLLQLLPLLPPKPRQQVVVRPRLPLLLLL